VLIDGFTVFAQMVNFLVLVLLLKRFLYGPVMRVMEEREARIVAAVAQSETAEIEARRHAEELVAQQRDLMEARGRLMADAKAEVEQWRSEKIERLRAEIETLRQSWMEKVDHDRQAFLMKLKTDAVRQVMRMGGHVIRDLADDKMESRIISVFIEKMAEGKNEFQSATYTGPVRLISGFELGEADKARVRETFARWFPSAGSIGFEMSRDLRMGIEALAGDRKVAWNLDKYLNDLEKEMLRVIPPKRRNAA
jgi:F-type H+-transporting ATPase subunit b